jgi:hypothetical protein
MANTSVGRQAASSKWLVRDVAGSRGAAGGQQGGSRVETLTDHGRCCFVGLLGYQPLTVGVCDYVLDGVEDIDGKTVIELMQEEQKDLEKDMIQTGKCICKKESERYDA